MSTSYTLLLYIYFAMEKKVLEIFEENVSYNTRKKIELTIKKKCMKHVSNFFTNLVTNKLELQFTFFFFNS
jgi:hypothetical protein